MLSLPQKKGGELEMEAPKIQYRKPTSSLKSLQVSSTTFTEVCSLSQLLSAMQGVVKGLILESKELPPTLQEPGRCAGSAHLTTRRSERTWPSRPSRTGANSATVTHWNYSCEFSQAQLLGLSCGKDSRGHHHLLLWVHRRKQRLAITPLTGKDFPGHFSLPGSLKESTACK